MAGSISNFLARKLLRPAGSYSVSQPPVNWVRPPPSSSFSTSTAVPSSQEAQRRSIWSKMLLFVPGAITFGLGTWQIFRRQEKIKTLEYQKGRLEMEPLKCDGTALATEMMDSLEFRKVQCKGVFDEKSSILVGPRSRSISGVTENGYYLITPLKTIPENSGSLQTILVNRGWVPRSWRDKYVENPDVSHQLPSTSSSPTQESAKSSWWRYWSKKPMKLEENHPAVTPVEVIGVARGSEKPSIFVPANDPNSGQWFYVDVPAIARACGLPKNTVYIEDINENIDPGNPYPLPKDVSTLLRSSVMPQDHLNYTLTWYSLSAAVTFMAYKRLNPRRR